MKKRAKAEVDKASPGDNKSVVSQYERELRGLEEEHAVQDKDIATVF